MYDWLTVETIDQSKLTVVTQTIPVVLGPEISEEATERFILVTIEKESKFSLYRKILKLSPSKYKPPKPVTQKSLR